METPKSKPSERYVCLTVIPEDRITKSKTINVSMERKEASFFISIQQDDCSTRTVYYSRITSYGKKSLPYLREGSCHGKLS
ncbi:hypothetical protein T08_1139 [Trichinella sp. T8]|nr:hypothetical protein T08_1139 [Trichinella sp. T8]